MGILLVGFHVEGWDHLILRSFIAALLGISEDEIVPDWIDVSGRGWEFVLQNLQAAVQRFYNQCAQLAVVGIDNDGNEDLAHTGAQEDVERPRHWNHQMPVERCRYCQIALRIAAARRDLGALARKPAETWPILIAVPVEAIEAWLLELQAIVDPARGLALAENRRRNDYKRLLYGKPTAPRQDVEQVALPLVRCASTVQIAELRRRSRSFDQFATQVDQSKDLILGSHDCWGIGDGGAERPPAPAVGK